MSRKTIELDKEDYQLLTMCIDPNTRFADIDYHKAHVILTDGNIEVLFTYKGANNA